MSRLEYFQMYKRGLKSKWGWLKWCRTDASVKLMSCITVIDFWSARIQNLMNQKNLIWCGLRKNTNFLQHLKHFLKCRIGFKESNAQFLPNWCLALLYYAFDEVKGELWQNIETLTVTFKEKFPNLLRCSEFFWKYKRDLKTR